jgi:subtilisin-like proprotein convertase family protein
VQGAGNWRLTVEDTEADGKSGVLLEWCLSTIPNVPQLQIAAGSSVPAADVFDSGFE